jgi:hypothetical protein
MVFTELLSPITHEQSLFDTHIFLHTFELERSNKIGNS